MIRKFVVSFIAVSTLAVPALASGAAASTPNATSILTRALNDAAHKTSMTVSGRFKQSGITENFFVGYNSVAAGGPISFIGYGTGDLVLPNVGNYYFVKGSSLFILKNVFKVTAPTTAEIGVWYKVSKSDPLQLHQSTRWSDDYRPDLFL